MESHDSEFAEAGGYGLPDRETGWDAALAEDDERTYLQMCSDTGREPVATTVVGRQPGGARLEAEADRQAGQ
jgi:hypothetical protein